MKSVLANDQHTYRVVRGGTKEGFAVSASYLVPVIIMAIGYGAYFTLRYLGLWAENDTTAFAQAIVGLQETGSINHRGAYPHGYAFQVWMVTLSHLTGIDVTRLLQLFTPLLGNILLALFGYAAFTRLLASERLGALAAGVLFLVPELVFTVSRGNHEKLTVALTLLALLAVLNSVLEMFQARRWGVFAGWVAVYYLTAFTLVSTNVLFGSSFIFASTLTLAFALVLIKLKPQGQVKLGPVVQRLVLVVGTSWLVVVLVMFYLYPQAGNNLNLLATTIEKLSALFLSFEPGADPFALIDTDWVSREAFQLVSSFRWVLFATSLLTWLILLVQMFRRLDQTPLPRLFLIALYGAFGLQVALAIPVDFLGLAAGTNLQVRMYTYFSILAAPMFALGLAGLVAWLKPGFIRDAVVAGVGVLLVGFVLLSLLKATLDPTVSNRWLFYRNSEVVALRFWDVQQVGDSIWVGPEARIVFAYRLEFPQRLPNNNRFMTGDDLGFTSALYSRVLIENSIAWRAGVPAIINEQRIYDNGEAQIFRRIPRSPFQR